jgi:hypothetical protein
VKQRNDGQNRPAITQFFLLRHASNVFHDPPDVLQDGLAFVMLIVVVSVSPEHVDEIADVQTQSVLRRVQVLDPVDEGLKVSFKAFGPDVDSQQFRHLVGIVQSPELYLGNHLDFTVGEDVRPPPQTPVFDPGPLSFSAFRRFLGKNAGSASETLPNGPRSGRVLTRRSDPAFMILKAVMAHPSVFHRHSADALHP